MKEPIGWDKKKIVTTLCMQREEQRQLARTKEMPIRSNLGQ